MSKRYNSNRVDAEVVIGLVVILFCIIMVCIAFYRPINKISNIRDVTVTITDKAVKNAGDTGKYLVFSEDLNGNVHTFEVTDSWLKGRLDASDDYAALKVGNTYVLTVGGSRNRLLSWYPNIYEYQLLELED